MAAVGGGLLVVIALLGLALKRPDTAEADRTPLQSQEVEPRPFASTLTVVGAVTPGDTADVAAPFEGVVKSVSFAYGDHVTQGQVLAEIDTTDLSQRRAEALAAYLKAAQSAAEMADWSKGPDMSRARRAVSAATSELEDTRRKTQETKALLDRGLVARAEYEGLIQQQRSEEMSLAAAQQDLSVTLAQGRGPNRRVAELELAGARAQLAALDAALAGAVLRAPATGVIVRPPSDKAGEGEGGGGVHAGQQLSKGQLIGQVARPGGLAVAFRLGETDADQVRPGDPVTVSGPGFGDLQVKGHIASVAGEASPSSANSGPLASFAATARLDPLPPQQAATIRIGMTANIAIDLYSNPRALVAPPGAIEGSGASATVTLRQAGTGRLVRTQVRLGHVAPDGVEIVSGLKPGDVIVWHERPANAGAAPGS
ncbi:efflux RND transporter periplasmic adaptor subunit [Phenylobacterium montanum]|uniref:HlyD family efflux transporter periplasmic adaptor subunit n=1 Tax=Phenylobacterium montanum TaxID=2823693 RepID=A0A975G3A3_9CAUL|nr:HlyD family efflux transporter periplasmic adaptor subunit [Caulobacter sp. S6]QUD89782.1 HlyD family efflux transporter periplasmic adaptor subunit [Caulobacter sp. S6]